MISDNEYNKAKKTIELYNKQETKRLKDNNLCLICKKPIGRPIDPNSLHWCDNCFNDSMNAGEDERGNPIY